MIPKIPRSVLKSLDLAGVILIGVSSNGSEGWSAQTYEDHSIPEIFQLGPSGDPSSWRDGSSAALGGRGSGAL